MIPRAGMNRFAHHLWVATRDNKWLVLIVLVALFARITWSLAHVEAPSSDAAVYDRLARDLASGVGYVNEEGLPTAYMPVGYPAFLAAIYMIFGHSWTAGVIANAFVSSLSVLLAYILAREVHSSRRLSLVVAGLVALLPSHIHYAAQLLTESLHTAFVLGAMIITFRLVRRPNWAGAVLLGIIIGLGVYIRPVLLFFPMIVGILLVIYQGSEKVKSSIALTVIVGVVALATILPWTARNYFVMREPILTSTNGGYNFFIGNGPRATGLYRRASDDTEFANFSELDWHKEGYRLGLENVVRHPVEWVSLLPKKFYFLWAHNLRSVVHYLLTGQYRTDPVSFGMVVSMLCWVALGVTAIVALFTRSLRNYWLKFPAVLLLLMLVYWTGFHMLVFGVGRFSMQMGPVLAIIGVHLLDGQRDWRSWLSPRMS